MDIFRYRKYKCNSASYTSLAYNANLKTKVYGVTIQITEDSVFMMKVIDQVIQQSYIKQGYGDWQALWVTTSTLGVIQSSDPRANKGEIQHK